MSETDQKSVCDALDQLALEAAEVCPMTGGERRSTPANDDQQTNVRHDTTS